MPAVSSDKKPSGSGRLQKGLTKAPLVGISKHFRYDVAEAARRFVQSDELRQLENFARAKNCCSCAICDGIPTIGSYACEEGHVTCLDCVDLKDLKCREGETESSLGCGLIISVADSPHLIQLFNAMSIIDPDAPKNHFAVAATQQESGSSEVIYCMFSMCAHRKLFYADDRKKFSRDSLLKHLLYTHRVLLYQSWNTKISHDFVEDKLTYFTETGSWKIAFLMRCRQTYFVCVYGREIIDGKKSFVVTVQHFSLGSAELSLRKTYSGDILLIVKPEDETLPTVAHHHNGMIPNVVIPRKEVLQSLRCLIIDDDEVPYGRRNIQIRVKRIV